MLVEEKLRRPQLESVSTDFCVQFAGEELAQQPLAFAVHQFLTGSPDRERGYTSPAG
jgi:hypothetical protein